MPNYYDLIAIIHDIEEDARRKHIDLDNEEYSNFICDNLSSFVSDHLKVYGRPVINNNLDAPFIGDGRYTKFPNKQSLDELRVKYYEEKARDLSITSCGTVSAFNNDACLYANAYRIRGDISFTLMFEQLFNFREKDERPTIIAKVPIISLFDEQAGPTINLLSDFIRSQTGFPVNITYTDDRFKEVAIARVGTATFRNNDIFDFFYRFGDDYELGEYNIVDFNLGNFGELQDDEKERVKEILSGYRAAIISKAGIESRTIEAFNGAIKKKIPLQKRN